jgi:hypothetical protein
LRQVRLEQPLLLANVRALATSESITAEKERFMARDGNTYAKKARETLKRQKAQEKRERRQKRKEPSGTDNSRPGDPPAANES